MKIAISGSRGIPNRYGGFEQFAEQLASELPEHGIEVYVYCPHNHEYKSSLWKAAQLIRCYCPGFLPSAVSQIIYDLLCILDSRKRKFDIIYQLGYTSSSIWFWLHPAGSVIITNMDGIEWKRKKYSFPVRQFLKFAEKMAVKKSHWLIADSEQVKSYLDQKFHADTIFIPYFAEIPDQRDLDLFQLQGLESAGYYLLIARLQPDNNIEMIIRGYIRSGKSFPLIIVGNYDHAYGRYLRKKYSRQQVVFYGALYDKNQLNSLRFHSKLYFHGHSAGGTNPSLLEAMASQALICAGNNPFNHEVLADNAFYFSTEEEVSAILAANIDKADYLQFIGNNLETVKTRYSKKTVIGKYISFFRSVITVSG